MRTHKHFAFAVCVPILAISLAGCTPEKKESDYRAEADAKIAVNDLAGAESALKDGILASQSPSSSPLIADLINLYIRSNQYEKLEQYMGVASITGAEATYYEGWRIVAQHHYEQRNWAGAYSAYFKLARELADPVAPAFTDRIKQGQCPELAAKFYERASAAAYNADNNHQYLQVGGALQQLNRDPRCNGSLAKYLDTWNDMFPK